MSSSDISTLLRKWSDAKAEITRLEKTIEKYKRVASKIMEKQGNSTLTGSGYTLRRKNMTRTTIGKRDVPQAVWEKYSRPCSFEAYYLSKNK